MKRLAIVGFGGAGYNAAKAARSVSPLRRLMFTRTLTSAHIIRC